MPLNSDGESRAGLLNPLNDTVFAMADTIRPSTQALDRLMMPRIHFVPARRR